ncbi:MAG: DNA adenine methylase [Spirochaetaceae bacterium]|nr:DNA adenine methylase [Spirochaetaceae bacterium]
MIIDKNIDCTSFFLYDIVLPMNKQRAGRNRTLTVSPEEYEAYRKCIINEKDFSSFSLADITNSLILGDFFSAVSKIPHNCVDLLIVDPPYNLTKNYHGSKFNARSDENYKEFTSAWITACLPLLKEDASIYVCCDWKSSCVIYDVLKNHSIVQNRITWQREKGRGAQSNWKNSLEDIWFATVSDDYYFNSEAVKQRKRVIAPYKENGIPKDWDENADGKFRLTCASNFWDDISIPFWSMSENTDHPTQKPEKLLAKLILASSKPDSLIFDPFSGSGSTLAAAKKLERSFIGIEQNEEYCVWALKRLQKAEEDKSIQGYYDGVFWERNSRPN